MKSTVIKIEFVRNDGYVEDYLISIELVDKLDHGAKGQYIPIRHQNHFNAIPKIKLVYKPTKETVIHESFHACIDMLRTYKESFDELFDCESSSSGEEAFIYYSFDIAKHINNFIKRINK